MAWLRQVNMGWMILFTLLPLVLGGMLSPTDTITWGGDNSRAGYQPGHNMDPSVVGSSSFGQLFKTLLPGNYGGAQEQIFSQPLVYTLNDGIQYVFVATTMNNLYKINAKTGAIVSRRNMHIPFLTKDLDGCVDINPLIGVTATGVIDPGTDTWYLTAKTYLDQTDQIKGRDSGRYYFHAIDVNTLSEKPGFPVDLEGTLSRNTNGARMFQGGIHHQRPALLHSGAYIYAGFASHCVQYNYTGWIMGWNKDTGANVEAFTMEGGPEANTVKGGGIWMSGGGLASDGQGSMFFATGNGYASQLHGIAVSGHQPPSALEEAAVHMRIGDDGTLSVVDFFMPWEKTQLDGADKDLGTTPLELLPTDVFTCANAKRLGIVTGKSGKTYLLNIDNLGGYQMGANHLDAVPQVIANENSVYAGAGVYPLEGGYIYINVIQYPTHVFKFNCDASGNPTLTKVADSPGNNAYILGVGHGTVTSLNGQAGTGLVWTSDVEGSNLRIYNAVPVNGLMTLVNAFNIEGVTKFTRPVFGDARAYIGTTKGALYAFGSPVNLPLNCSSPYDFGTVAINSTSSAKVIQCTANAATQITSVKLAGNKNFAISGVPQLPISVAAGASFSFQAAFSPISPGPLSSDIVLNTTANGYSPNTPVSLKGTGESSNALLGITPNTLSYQGVITGEQVGGVNSSAIFLNQGNGNLTITSIDFSVVSEGGTTVTPNITAGGPQVGPFTFLDLPTSIPGKSQVTIVVNFNPTTSGNFAAYLTVHSNGGDKIFDVVATSGTYPVALVEFQAADGSGTWIPYSNTSAFSFGTVLEQQTRTLKMRLTNKGDANAGRLSVTVSKPPFGVSGSIIGAVNGVDLAEGTTIGAGESATASLYCSVPKSQVNVDSYNGTAQWTMNTGDPTAGKMFIQFACQAVSEQLGPLASNGSGIYRYDFCAIENNPGRQLSDHIYSSNNNTNDMCLTACAAKNYKYCSSEYVVECWGGNSVPVQSTLGRDCNFPCAGDNTQNCGGNGLYANGSYMSLFVNPALAEGAPLAAAGGTTPVSLSIPKTIGAFSYVGCYTEATNGRALASSAVANNSMTLEICASQMQAYSYFAVEYGGECYGSNTLGAGSVPATPTDCSMACRGNATEACGAGNRLQLYANNSTISSITPSASGTASATALTATLVSSATPSSTGPVTVQSLPGWSYIGCYTEATNGRALSGLINPISGTKNSIENCAAACIGYTYFGTEYASECYCGNVLNTGSIIAPGGNDTTQNGCSMTCLGASLEYCGGGNRLNTYVSVPVNSSTTSTTLSTSTSTSTALSSKLLNSTVTTLLSTSTMSTTTTSTSISVSTATPTPTGPITVQTLAGYSYLGCYSEATAGRALSDLQNPIPAANVSIESCASACSKYTYFGTEYSGECYCGNTIQSGSALVAGNSPDVTGCNMVCKYNSNEFCGGPSRLNMYIQNATAAVSKSLSLSATLTTSTSLTSSTGLPSTALTTSTSITTSMSVSSTTASTSTIASLSTILSTISSSTNSSTSSSTMQSTITANSTSSTSVAATSTSIVSTSTSSITSITTTVSSALSTSSAASSTTSTSSGSSLTSSATSSTLSSSSVTSLTSSTASSTLSTSSVSSPTITVLTSSRATITSTATSSSAAVSSTGPAVAQVSSWKYLGCFTEGTSGRALASFSTSQTNMTAEYCASLTANKYQFFGLEYGRECYGSNSFSAGSTQTNASDCSMACSGNSTELCGGRSRLNVYQATSTGTSLGLTTVSMPTPTSTFSGPITVQSLVGYSYMGCYNEIHNARALIDLQNPIPASTVSIETCASACIKYKYFGVEYSSECYCGNIIQKGSDLVMGNTPAINGCNMICRGNTTEICGGSNRLNIYVQNATATSATSSLASTALVASTRLF